MIIGCWFEEKGVVLVRVLCFAGEVLNLQRDLRPGAPSSLRPLTGNTTVAIAGKTLSCMWQSVWRQESSVQLGTAHAYSHWRKALRLSLLPTPSYSES